MNILISSDAESDIADAYVFYNAQELGLGEYFRSAIFADIESLRFYGGTHPVVEGYSRALCKRFPYSNYYRLSEPDCALIIKVVDQRRSPDWIRGRLESPEPSYEPRLQG
jgi:hypothetical protein